MVILADMTTVEVAEGIVSNIRDSDFVDEKQYGLPALFTHGQYPR